MIIRSIVFSNTPPAFHNVLWIKAGDNNINTLYVYDGGWRKIGTSSDSGTSDYNDLGNKPRINNVVLEGDLTLQELGIILPDLSEYVTDESLNVTLQSYAKKSDIPSVAGLLSKTEAESTYQKKGDYALKSEIPDTSDFITGTEVDKKLEEYATIGDIPDTSDLATKDELNSAISEQKFKTINRQEVTGEGNIEISGGGINYHEVPELAEDYMVTSNPSLTNEEVYYIKIGATVHKVIGDSTIKWQDGKSPVSEANSTIVVSVLNNLAVWGIFK